MSEIDCKEKLLLHVISAGWREFMKSCVEVRYQRAFVTDHATKSGVLHAMMTAWSHAPIFDDEPVDPPGTLESVWETFVEVGDNYRWDAAAIGKLDIQRLRLL